jgi:dihydroxy-acid dehydratase
LVQTGDRIRLSVRDRKLDLLVAEDELARRRAAWQPAPAPKRGWDKLVYDQVTQAPLGADLAFLRAAP